MFTGIVEELGVLKEARKGSKSAFLKIQGQKVLEGVQLGDSIAVNGVCLTVTDFQPNYFTADVMNETLEKTNLGQLKIGEQVNLERALTLGTRLGGHLVSGHIDGVGKILTQRQVDIALVTEIEASSGILKYVIPKGSIAIDGISLTVIEVTDNSFSVSLIPHTAKLTTLGFKKVGDRVNLEADLIGKYVERLLGFKANDSDDGARNKGISLDYLSQHGFL